ncbi:MAG: ABC transporter substrate-binding protein [Proteobacteria bacterium]|nr:ABC transporter substrate-binding protein [Pseudomonadota bacterium]
MIKKFSLFATILALLSSPLANAADAHVAVSQIVEHPALDACRNGLKDGLAAAGYIEGENLKFEFQTAQGNPATASQIARQFIGESPDVLVGIATPTAQALASATKTIPVVFSAVTDPVGAKLISNMEKPGGNVTGLSDLSPVGQHVATMLEIVPNAKTIGVVYNLGEANAVSLVELLKAEASKAGVSVLEGTVNRSADVGAATQAIVEGADIIYAITDNTVASAIAAMVKVANSANTPIFAAATSYVEEGAVAAVGFDYYQIGFQTADYVVQILKGANPGDLAARVAKGTDIVINPAAAKKLGITLPASLTANPTRVVN